MICKTKDKNIRIVMDGIIVKNFKTDLWHIQDNVNNVKGFVKLGRQQPLSEKCFALIS